MVLLCVIVIVAAVIFLLTNDIVDTLAICSCPILYYISKILDQDIGGDKLLIIYVSMLIFSFVGWEIWFSEGLAGGKSLQERLQGGKIGIIPNSIINSLLDSAVSLIQIIVAVELFGKKVLDEWNWEAFAVIAFIGVLQNFIVSILWSHKRKTGAHNIHESCEFSWAPAAPIQTNREFISRSVSLATMEPWFIQPIILYGIALSLSG